MRSKVVKLNKTIIFSIILFLVFLYCIFMICIDQVNLYSFETRNVSNKAEIIQINSVQATNIININKNMQLKEYEDFPREYKGCVVVGKIKIPKLEIKNIF